MITSLRLGRSQCRPQPCGGARSCTLVMVRAVRRKVSTTWPSHPLPSTVGVQRVTCWKATFGHNDSPKEPCTPAVPSDRSGRQSFAAILVRMCAATGLALLAVSAQSPKLRLPHSKIVQCLLNNQLRFVRIDNIHCRKQLLDERWRAWPYMHASTATDKALNGAAALGACISRQDPYLLPRTAAVAACCRHRGPWSAWQTCSAPQ